jgi:LDH2 family malate/lactate/ureidoglycolate dehydrogenase
VCAPWGGTKAVTGTNPMSIAIPTGGDFPIVLDFATTIVSQGRVKTQLLENKTLPEGWLIDRNGLSVKGGELSLQNFNEFWKRGGTLLPFGAYKGYGINLVIDILGGALNLSGTGSRAKGQGALMMALCIDAFVPVRKFKREVGRLMKEIKSSPVRPGFQQVLLPGEMQYRVLKKRTKEGIPIDDFSWQSLLEACKKLGIDTESLIAPYCR